MEMVTKLLGVEHSAEKSGQVVGKLAGLKQGQTIMLEVTPREINIFEEFLASNESPWKRFRQIKQDIAKKRIEAVKEKTGEEAFLDRRLKEVKDYFDGFCFHFDVFKYAREKGAKVVPLDSNSKSIGSRLEREGRTREYLTEAMPIRERFWVRKVIKAKPDFVVFGSGHLNSILHRLKRKGFDARIHYREPGKAGVSVEQARKIRKAYAQKRKRRQARARLAAGRKKKPAGKKP